MTALGTPGSPLSHLHRHRISDGYLNDGATEPAYSSAAVVASEQLRRQLQREAVDDVKLVLQALGALQLQLVLVVDLLGHGLHRIAPGYAAGPRLNR